MKIVVEQSILSEDEFSKSNLLTITLDSMYAVPESWISNSSGKEYAYTASLPLPLNEEKDNAIVFVNGMLKAATDPLIKQKRWVDTRGIQATNALYMPNSTQEEPNAAEELGDFQSKEDKDYRVNSEKEKHRISWNSERRCYLNQISNNA